ncbi:MAG: hypothetical protein KGI56_07725, partial [Acidobacteriota bacterium]|nr:hypothetical protein [Acidobacteriota bacterium]
MDTFPDTVFWLAVFVNLLIFVSSLDDAFIDAYFWIRHLYRRLVTRRRHPRLKLESLHAAKEAPF